LIVGFLMERFFDGILAIHHECIAVVAAHLCAELETVVGGGDEPTRRQAEESLA